MSGTYAKKNYMLFESRKALSIDPNGSVIKQIIQFNKRTMCDVFRRSTRRIYLLPPYTPSLASTFSTRTVISRDRHLNSTWTEDVNNSQKQINTIQSTDESLEISDPT